MPFQLMYDKFFREAGFVPKFVCRVDDPSAISSLVRAGLGVALVGNCGGSSGESMRLLRIESPTCQRSYQVVWNENKYLSLAARHFRDFLADYFSNAHNSRTKRMK